MQANYVRMADVPQPLLCSSRRGIISAACVKVSRIQVLGIEVLLTRNKILEN